MNPDQTEIRQAIEEWVIYRDSGDWDRFAELWHKDGYMVATWFKAKASDFVARARRAWGEGFTSFHVLGGSAVTVNGSRAVSQSRMQIIQRAPVHGVIVDVMCLGRFWDAWEKVDGQWKLLFRQPVYELDTMAPVDLSASISLDPELLARFPMGYRHLAYLQTEMGFDVVPNLPGTRGPEIEALQALGRSFLAGEPPAFVRP